MFKLKTIRALILHSAFIILISLSFTLTPRAQTAATLSGAVQDENGAVIPGVDIEVKNYATSQTRHAVSNEDGNFTVPLLPPGTYTITATRDGFTPVKATDVVLNVGDQKSFSFQMKVGSVGASVDVTSEASLVNTSPALATTIDRTFVGNLPLNGRSFQSLILLTPGIVATPATLGTPGEFSVNGQRQNANYFTVDGVSANTGVSAVWNGSTPSAAGSSQQMAGSVPGNTALGTTSSLISVDSLEEFKIQTSTYSAQYGRQPGAQVQLVTRAGTNDFHGSAFDYLRNEKLDANNWFTNATPLSASQAARGITKQPRLPLRQNDFGGTFSGPLMFPSFGEGGKSYWSGRNKMFFFLSYEGARLLIPVVSNNLIVPSLRLRQIAAPSVQPFLNAFPLPSGPETLVNGVPTGGAPFVVSYSNPSAVDAYSIRIDHNVNRKLSVFGRYGYTPSSSLTRLLSELQGTVLTARTVTFGATFTASSRLINEFKFNYSSNRGQNSLSMDDFGGAVPIITAQVTSGYSGSGSVFGVVNFQIPNATAPSFRLGRQVDSFQRQINVVNNVSLIKGSHAFRFGIDWRRSAPTFGPWSFQQFLAFRSEASVTSGTADQVDISAYKGARPIFDNYSAYVQDTWKISRRFSLDVGLRWELNPAPHDRNGLKPVFLTGINGRNVSNATLASPDTPFYKTFYTAFAPRVGIAYEVNQTKGHETVVRGGFGVYYDLGNGEAATAFGGFPFFSDNFVTNIPLPLSPAQSAPAAFPPVTLPLNQPITTINPDLKLPFTLEWNFGLEQSLGLEQAVSISYVASAARNLLSTQILNRGFNGAPRPNPNFADISFVTNGPSSDYQSLQIQYRHRLSRGLQTLANYTWSHAIDTASNEFLNVLDRGNADFDVRHNFSAAVTYDLPKWRRTGSGARFVGSLVNGWSLSAIFLARTGTPFDLTAGNFVSSDGALLSIRPDVIVGVPFWIKDSTVAGGQRLNPVAFQRPPTSTSGVFIRQGTLARNAVYLPGIYQVNMSAARRFGLGERLRLQLRADIFNLLNHPLFGSYGNRVGNSNFGVPGAMLGTSLNQTGAGGLNSLYQIGGPRSIQLSARISF